MKPSGWTFWMPWAGILFGLTVLFWMLPAFHIVSLKAARQESTGAPFDAAVFVEKLWTDQLIPSTQAATDAAILMTAIRNDPKAARSKYGRIVGLGDTYHYFVKGEGRILAVDKSGVSLSLDSSSPTPDIIVETGNIFGNAVRDGTGVLNVSSFSNSQDFNAISSEINLRIEQRVLPILRGKAALGATLQFAGCVEVNNDETDLHPLRLVPLSATVR